MNPQLLTADAQLFPPISLPALCPPPAFSDVVLRHLQTRYEIDRVLHLREEIDLSVHTAAGLADFMALEKKETNAVLFSALSSMARQ